MIDKGPNYNRPPLINQTPDIEFQKQIGRLFGEEKSPKIEQKKANPEFCWRTQKPEGDIAHAVLWTCPRVGCPEYNVNKSFTKLIDNHELVGVTSVENSPFEPSKTKEDRNYIAYCKCGGCEKYYGLHMFDPVAEMIAEEVKNKRSK